MTAASSRIFLPKGGTEINFQNNYSFKAEVFLKSMIFHHEKPTFRRFMLQAKVQNA